jgi:hypothetical protein
MSNRPNPLAPEVQEALQQGKLLHAIQLLRKSGGLGLKEAAEQIRAQAGPHHPAARGSAPEAGSGLHTGTSPHQRTDGLSPGQVGKSADRFWGGVLLATAALAAYYLLR